MKTNSKVLRLLTTFALLATAVTAVTIGVVGTRWSQSSVFGGRFLPVGTQVQYAAPDRPAAVGQTQHGFAQTSIPADGPWPDYPAPTLGMPIANSPAHTFQVPGIRSDSNNPGQFGQTETRVWTNVNGVHSIMTHADDSQEMEIRGLVDELRSVPSEKRSAEKIGQLRNKVSEQFKRRHRAQSDRLARVMADVARTQEILDRRDNDRNQIINRRVDELLGQQDPLQWDYQPSAPSGNSAFPNSPSADFGSFPVPTHPPLPNLSFQPAQQAPANRSRPDARDSSGTLPPRELRNSSGPSADNMQPSITSADSLHPPPQSESDVQRYEVRVVPSNSIEKQLEQNIQSNLADVTDRPVLDPSEARSQAILSVGQRIEALEDQWTNLDGMDFPSEAEREIAKSQLESRLASAKAQWQFELEQMVRQLAREQTAFADATAAREFAEKAQRKAIELQFKGRSNNSDVQRATADVARALDAWHQAQRALTQLERRQEWADKFQQEKLDQEHGHSQTPELDASAPADLPAKPASPATPPGVDSVPTEPVGPTHPEPQFPPEQPSATKSATEPTAPVDAASGFSE